MSPSLVVRKAPLWRNLDKATILSSWLESRGEKEDHIRYTRGEEKSPFLPPTGTIPPVTCGKSRHPPLREHPGLVPWCPMLCSAPKEKRHRQTRVKRTPHFNHAVTHPIFRFVLFQGSKSRFITQQLKSLFSHTNNFLLTPTLDVYDHDCIQSHLKIPPYPVSSPLTGFLIYSAIFFLKLQTPLWTWHMKNNNIFFNRPEKVSSLP